MREKLRKLGIETMADLQLFKDTQVAVGERLEVAVDRYFEEVFGDENN